MEQYEIYTKPFKALWSNKVTRKHRESKKDFIKRCRANNKPYKDFMKRHNVINYTIQWRKATEEMYMMERWNKRHPQPEPDFFDVQCKWKNEREAAIQRIRDLIASRYDKLSLVGRFKKTENEFVEKEIAQLKDIDGQGHKVNDVPKTAKLIKKAQSVTNEVHRRTPSLVAAVLHDHVKKRGRMILPRAA